MSQANLEEAIKESRATSVYFVVLSEPVLTQFCVNILANFEVRNRCEFVEITSWIPSLYQLAKSQLGFGNDLLKPIYLFHNISF